jgi:SAM-dependent methyltransferase
MNFDEKYYRSNNYTDYMGRGDRYIRLADEVNDFLSKTSLNQNPVLDFGCAVGFLLQRLSELHENSYGVDISEFALEECQKKNLEVRHEVIWSINHGVVYALDVFEHMDEESLRDFFTKLQTRCLVFRMPICAEGDDDYYLEVSRKDPTHKIKWTKKQWKDFFSDHQYISLDLNLATIYNSKGVYSGIAIPRAGV